MPFGASNIATTLGKRSRAAARNNDKDEDSESTTQSSSSDDDEANTETDIRTAALDAINDLRQNDEAAMDTILEAVLEQREKLDALQRLVHEKLDALQRLVHETGKQRRNNLNHLQEVISGFGGRRRSAVISARSGRSSRDNKRRMTVKEILRSPLGRGGGVSGSVSPSIMNRNPLDSRRVVPTGFRRRRTPEKTAHELALEFEQEMRSEAEDNDGQPEVEMMNSEDQAQEEEEAQEKEQEKECDKGKGKEKESEPAPEQEQKEKGPKDGEGEDVMDIDTAGITIEDDLTKSTHNPLDSPTTIPANRRNKARRTKPHKEMFAPTAAASAIDPSPQVVRRAMGLRGQAPLKYYKPIPLPGDEEDFNPATLFREESVSSSYAPSQPRFGRSHSVKSPTLKPASETTAAAAATLSSPRTPLKKSRSEISSSVRKTRAPGGQGDTDATMATPSDSRTVVDPHTLTPSQTREHNVNAINRALNRDRTKSNNPTPTKTPLKQQTISFFTAVSNRTPKAGEASTSNSSGGIGVGSSSSKSGSSSSNVNKRNGNKGSNSKSNSNGTTHTEDDKSPDIVQDLRNRFPSESEPTYNSIPATPKVFSRYHLATLIGGRKQDTFVKVRHKDRKDKYLAQIDKYLAFKTVWNPWLPGIAGDHGVAYVLQDMSHMEVNLTMPLFISGNEKSWKYLGDYEIHEAVDMGKREWDGLIKNVKEYWVKTLSTTAWGIKYLKTNGVNDTTAENVWRLLDAPDDKMNIRLPRRVLKFVKYDKDFYELLVNGSEALELSLSQSPKGASRTPVKDPQKGHQAQSPLTISSSEDEDDEMDGMDDELL